MAPIIDLTELSDSEDESPAEVGCGSSRILSIDPGKRNIAFAIVARSKEGQLKVEACEMMSDVDVKEMGGNYNCKKYNMFVASYLDRFAKQHLRGCTYRVVIENQQKTASFGRSWFGRGAGVAFAQRCTKHFKRNGVECEYKNATLRTNFFGAHVDKKAPGQKHDNQKRATLLAAKEFVKEHPHVCGVHAQAMTANDHCADAALMAIACMSLSSPDKKA